jgi:multidrug efflux pump subunit AcrB
MTPAGFYETPSDRVRIRVSGDFESLDSIREIGIQAGGRLFRLGDIATSNAVSPTRRRRACASRGRTRSASPSP